MAEVCAALAMCVASGDILCAIAQQVPDTALVRPVTGRSSTKQHRTLRSGIGKTLAQNERPVRGDNRTGQSHMGAWGGWALAPNIAVGEGLPLPQ